MFEPEARPQYARAPEQTRAADGLDLPILGARRKIVGQRRKHAHDLTPEPERARPVFVQRGREPVINVKFSDEITGSENGSISKDQARPAVLRNFEAEDISPVADGPVVFPPRNPSFQPV